MHKIVSIFLLSLLSLLASGCNGPRYVDFFPYNDDGALKPSVAMVPVINYTETRLPWSLTQEFTDGIRYEMRNDALLYFLSLEETKECIDKSGKVDFYVEKEVLVKNFCDSDFVVIIELLQHDYLPYGCFDPTPHGAPCFPGVAQLFVKIRVKVVDIRPRCSRIVLQEVITETGLVPSSCLTLSSTCNEEDATTYWAHSVRKMHHRIIHKLTKRLEHVIRSAY